MRNRKFTIVPWVSPLNPRKGARVQAVESRQRQIILQNYAAPCRTVRLLFFFAGRADKWADFFLKIQLLATGSQKRRRPPLFPSATAPLAGIHGGASGVMSQATSHGVLTPSSSAQPWRPWGATPVNNLKNHSKTHTTGCGGRGQERCE